jgi:hypothetical protein
MPNINHKTRITPYKKNRNKLWNLIFNQPNIEGWNYIYIYIKEHRNPPELTDQTRGPSYEVKITSWNAN